MTTYTLSATDKNGKLWECKIKGEIDRPTYMLVQARIQEDELSGIEVLLNAQRIDGSEVSELTNDPVTLASLGRQVLPLLQNKTATLKKN